MAVLWIWLRGRAAAVINLNCGANFDLLSSAIVCGSSTEPDVVTGVPNPAFAGPHGVPAYPGLANALLRSGTPKGPRTEPAALPPRP